MLAPTTLSELIDMIGGKQNAAPVLTSLSGLSGGTNKMVYMTGSSSLAICDITPEARLLLACADSSALCSLMGMATVATTGAYSDLTGLPSIPSGTVTSIVAGAGLSGGTITASGTISMPNTGTAGTYSGVTTDAQGRVTAGTTRSFNNAASRSLVSVAAAANGFQIDAARDADVTYSATITTTSSLSGGASGYVALEICSTNSATAANWAEISRIAGGQTSGLIVGLTLVSVSSGAVGGKVPGGWYARLRTVNSTGTPVFAFVGGQEAKL